MTAVAARESTTSPDTKKGVDRGVLAVFAGLMSG